MNKIKQKFEDVKSKLTRKAIKAEVERHVERNKTNYVMGGTLALSILGLYVRTERRHRMVKNSDETANLLGYIAKDINVLAQIATRDLEGRVDDAQYMNMLLAQGRDFEYVPGIGVRTAAKGKAVHEWQTAVVEDARKQGLLKTPYTQAD